MPSPDRKSFQGLFPDTNPPPEIHTRVKHDTANMKVTYSPDTHAMQLEENPPPVETVEITNGTPGGEPRVLFSSNPEKSTPTEIEPTA